MPDQAFQPQTPTSPTRHSQQQQQQQQQQHSSHSSPPTRSIFLTNPSARLSSSPASSPQIVSDDFLTRSQSVKPEVNLEPPSSTNRTIVPIKETRSGLGSGMVMAQDKAPGADFFYSDTEVTEEDGDGGLHDNEDATAGGNYSNSDVLPKSTGNSIEDDTDDDDSAWEDDNGTRDFTDVIEGIGLGIYETVDGQRSDGKVGLGAARGGRQGNGRRRNDTLHQRPFPPYKQLAPRDSGMGLSNVSTDTEPMTTGEALYNADSPLERKSTKKAQKMSVGRPGPAKVVHNYGSGSGANTPRAESLQDMDGGSLSSPEKSQRVGDSSTTLGRRHRRNTSESLHAVLQTHAMTMRALESLSPSASLSLAHAHARARSISHPNLGFGGSGPEPAFSFMHSQSLADNRHYPYSHGGIVTDPNRPPNLPTHFVKTPYPFMSKKEFPKPQTRPRTRGDAFTHAKAEDLASDKGQEVLGLGASEMDLLARKRRHMVGLAASEGILDAKGRGEGRHSKGVLRRAQSDGGTRGKKRPWVELSRAGTGGSTSNKESIVWLSLRTTNVSHKSSMARLEHIIVPSNLMMKGSDLTNGRKQASSNKHHTSDHGSTTDIDFDDKYFAERLRQSYRSLAGGWLRRTLSSRTLKYIELGRVSPWSGYSSCRDFRSTPGPPPLFSRLLARGRGRTSVDDDDASPFTEHNLMDLYRNPPSGKARYTWVHWARRLAASNESRTREDRSLSRGGGSSSVRSARTGDYSSGRDDKNVDEVDVLEKAFDPLSMSNDDGSSSGQHDTITSIQFVHGFSVLRIVSALAFVLASSIAAALLWVFLGRSGWVNLQAGGRGERVGPGVLAGILGLFVQLVLFAAWLVLI